MYVAGRSELAILAPLAVPLLLACGGSSDGGGDDGPTGPSPSNQSPSVTIDQPAADTSLGASYSSTFQGSAEDPEDGQLTGDALVWESNVDGRLGTGTSLTLSGLSTDQHTITLTASDSEGESAQASVGAAVVDVASADSLLTDPYADSLVGGFTATKQAAVDTALAVCDAALSGGDVPALEACLAEARAEADTTTDPNDRALGAALDLLLAHAERQLTP